MSARVAAGSSSVSPLVGAIRLALVGVTGLALVGAAGLALGAAPAAAQTDSSPSQDMSATLLPLFADHAPLELTITADFSALRDDRGSSPDRPALLTVPASRETSSDRTVDVGASIRTRGEFRLDPVNCSFPPLRIDVDGSDARGTVLDRQDDLKLVSSCRPGRSTYDELVPVEYLAYRTYQLLTDQSFRVRLLRLTLVDTSGETPPETRTAFVIEDADALGERLGATVFEMEEGKNLPATAFEPVARTRNAVFQYMIGNADWSEVAAHNVEVLDRSGVALVVPYDFDFSGVVDAPYAVPPADLGLDSVRERLYRGWCADEFTTRAVLQAFRAAREDVMALWSGAAGLGESPRRRATGYLEDFFDAIESDERAERRFLRDCRAQTG
jgi:hypothetical protein